MVEAEPTDEDVEAHVISVVYFLVEGEVVGVVEEEEEDGNSVFVVPKIAGLVVYHYVDSGVFLTIYSFSK